MSEEKKITKQEKNNLEDVQMQGQIPDFIKSDGKPVINQVYKKASELTIEDFQKMETCIVTLKDTFDKKKNSHRYSLTFRFDNEMEITKFISKNEYIIVTSKRKLDRNIQTHDFITACRFVKGEFDKADDDYWIRLDVFIAGGYIISEFLNGNDKYCVKVLGKDLGYTLVESDEKLDKKTVEFKEEVFTVSE